MNCCEQHAPYGCNQGRDCPVRITPAQAAGANWMLNDARQKARSHAQHFASGSIHADWKQGLHFDMPTDTPAHTRSCGELGLCQGRADCACSTGRQLGDRLPAAASAVPPEAGNVWFVDSELTPLSEFDDDADDWRPLSTRERFGLGLAFAVFGLAWLALVGMALGYGWERWAGAWAYEVSRAIFGGLLS